MSLARPGWVRRLWPALTDALMLAKHRCACPDVAPAAPAPPTQPPTWCGAPPRRRCAAPTRPCSASCRLCSSTLTRCGWVGAGWHYSTLFGGVQRLGRVLVSDQFLHCVAQRPRCLRLQANSNLLYPSSAGQRHVLVAVGLGPAGRQAQCRAAGAAAGQVGGRQTMSLAGSRQRCYTHVLEHQG